MARYTLNQSFKLMHYLIQLLNKKLSHLVASGQKDTAEKIESTISSRTQKRMSSSMYAY